MRPPTAAAAEFFSAIRARDASAAREHGPVLALPEAPRIDGVARVPDLGTALRRHPDVERVRVLGAGLVVRLVRYE